MNDAKTYYFFEGVVKWRVFWKLIREVPVIIFSLGGEFMEGDEEYGEC